MSKRRNPRFSRRAVLRAMGVSGAVAPFVPLLQSAAGGPETPPKRFLTFFTPHGTVRDAWLPSGTETEFVLPTILAPLAPFQDRVVVIDGLQVVPSGPPGGSHTVGPPYVFTGSPMLPGEMFYHEAVGTTHGWNSGASIDQAIADVIGNDTPFRSLELGIQSSPANHPGARISYAGPAQALAPLADPQFLFSLLFGEQGIDTETAAKLKAERLAVIDTVLPELQSLQGKVAAADKFKIDAHLAAIEQMQMQFGTQFTCTAPELGAPVPGFLLPENMEAVARQQLDLLVAALACGATSVASVMCRVGENDNDQYPFLGFPELHHNDLTHAPDSDAVAWGKAVQIYRWYAEQLAYLCAELDAIVEPDGSTVLDNTLILWGSEVAKGNNHAWTDMPFVLVGGGGGSIETGRFLQFPGENHCRLLVSLANAMGLAVNEFGGFDDGSGPLPGVAT